MVEVYFSVSTSPLTKRRCITTTTETGGSMARIAVAIVRSINEISHLMGKRTIAECVENDSILDSVRELGVNYAQGYCIGRPQMISDITPPPTASPG